MRYKIGDIFTFANGTEGKIVEARENIAGGEEYDININGKIRNVIFNEDGTIDYN